MIPVFVARLDQYPEIKEQNMRVVVCSRSFPKALNRYRFIHLTEYAPPENLRELSDDPDTFKIEYKKYLSRFDPAKVETHLSTIAVGKSLCMLTLGKKNQYSYRDTLIEWLRDIGLACSEFKAKVSPITPEVATQTAMNL